MVAFTAAGDSVESEHAKIVLGDVPSQPPSAPSKDPGASAGTRLEIHYAALPTTLDGGLAIESYCLEMDDGAGGELAAITGLEVASLATSQLITTGIRQGATYRVRYRARNAYGWGPYSATAAILAAQAPERPPAAPQVLAVSDTAL